MIDLLKYFLFLGSTGFGGPLSLIQLMREEFVEKKQTITNEDFDQAFTMIKTMPGPIAFQMAVFLGYRFHKIKGALLAGFGILFPAFVMMVVIGSFYETVSQHSAVKYLLNGFLYTVSAVILLSLKGMVLTSYKNFEFWIILIITLGLAWYQILPEPILILGFGLLVVLIKNKIFLTKKSFFSVSFFLVDWDKLLPLFKICVYAGAFVFGTGLAILPVLKGSFVDQFHWLSLQEFNNGVIFGQMTPGPVTITATFLGYRISGFYGAVVATVGIFLMPFFHMVTWFPKALSWLSKQKWIKSFLLGATAAVVGSILVTIIKMNIDSMSSVMFWILFISTLVILLKKPKTSLILIIFTGGFINLIVSLAALHTI